MPAKCLGLKSKYEYRTSDNQEANQGVKTSDNSLSPQSKSDNPHRSPCKLYKAKIIDAVISL